ncbi:MAG: GatB/YqeY domain-containing protein [Halobacteriovoraceae bacterium]|nr:GatB/YqeY domain-containing protein [Halobacteriovoraceae bacterium]MCB9095251.1 GatB/YqeY domain-containing protein [Halobacteriovoraceae bacterium]
MNLKDQISEEIKQAMKARDKVKLNVLRYLKKLFIENDTSGNPKPELDIVIAHAKKIKDSISMFPEGSSQRQDIEKEVEILSNYLPQPLNEQQVKDLIENIKSKLDSPNMGAVMKELSAEIKGRFDGKKASQLVQEALK